jgi:hypothetical protein
MNVKEPIKKILKLTAFFSLLIFGLALVKTYFNGELLNLNLERVILATLVIVPCALVASISLYLKDERDKRENSKTNSK